MDPERTTDSDPEIGIEADTEIDPTEIDPDAPLDSADGDGGTEMPLEADPADVGEQRSSAEPDGDPDQV